MNSEGLSDSDISEEKNQNKDVDINEEKNQYNDSDINEEKNQNNDSDTSEEKNRNDASDHATSTDTKTDFDLTNGALIINKSSAENVSVIANGTATVSKNDLNCVLQTSKNLHVSSNSEQELLVNDELQLSNINCEQLKKVKEIFEALTLSDIKDLSNAAISKHGLVTDDIRRMVWPKLIGMDIFATSPRPTTEEIENHPYYQQVVLDVNRSLKRFPPSIKEKQRLAMQDQLVLLIMRVLVKHPNLHYYQGYHDICVTFLLVLGEEMAFHVVNKLSISHLEVFMKKSMEPTTDMLTYIFPVIQKEKPKLFEFLEQSEVGVMFALSWLITWFGHVLNNYSDVVRLFDLFIASNHWLPVYLAAAIVLYRESEVMEQDCDMACVHSLLSSIPDDLPFEKLITESLRLYYAYPPKSLEKLVLKQIQKKKAALKLNPRHNKQIMTTITKVVHTVLPRGTFAVSIVIAAAVVVSAVLYQAYKT